MAILDTPAGPAPRRADPWRATVLDSIGDTPLLRVDDTAYVEVAQACGLHLVEPEHRDALAASSYGVGQLLAAAAEIERELGTFAHH